jgi:hypothetical protein
MASSSTGSIKLASSSPRFDTLTRFDPGHMRRRSFGAGRKSVSAYETAQGQGKPASSPFAKKT